jgi:hypothetical protein
LTKYYVSSVVHSIHPITCYKFEMQQFNVHIILSNVEFVDIKEAKIQSKPSNMIWAPSDLIPIKKENQSIRIMLVFNIVTLVPHHVVM